MARFILTVFIKLRWWYFHINPIYTKFYIDSERAEAHFLHRRTGQVHSNFKWKKTN
jgi:hypothetical protein